jgi:hypothetical protein
MIRYRVFLRVLPEKPYEHPVAIDRAAWQSLAAIVGASFGALSRPGVTVDPELAQVGMDVEAGSVGAALAAVEGIALEALPGRIIEAHIRSVGMSVPGVRVSGDDGTKEAT